MLPVVSSKQTRKRLQAVSVALPEIGKRLRKDVGDSPALWSHSDSGPGTCDGLGQDHRGRGDMMR